MGVNNAARSVKAKDRKGFTVPGSSGDYAPERITFGSVAVGTVEASIDEIQALAEGSANAPFVPGCVVELWLPRLVDAAVPVGSLTDADYTLAGTNYTSLSAAGSIRWDLAAYAGGQIRVKSGGTAGTQYVSASAL